MPNADSATITLYIDDQACSAKPGEMIIQVSDREGIYIPRFCYHKKLSIAANCRMCLVEVEKAPKALPACATPVADGMKVYTRSPSALKAQKAVMEFLLINHPLDCPICDQGGECELQDVSMGFGGDISRFTERKRVVADENLSALISTHMTRCIHCTRCVRFGQEIAGVPELGVTERGGHAKISTYLERGVKHELSGNIIDICPVGALTSRPFKFRGRSWEFISHQAVSLHDCVGSNLDIQTVGLGYEHRSEVMRVLPRENEAINETWLSDRDRFSYQAIAHPKRLQQPMIRVQGQWQAVSWQVAFDYVVDHLTRVLEVKGADAVGGLISPNATVEELYLFQKWLRGLGVRHLDHRIREYDHRDADAMPAMPGMTSTLPELAKQRAILMIGANPRQDHPLTNHRIRQAALAGARVMSLHAAADDCNWPMTLRFDVPPHALVQHLAAIVKATSQLSHQKIDMPAGLSVRVNDQIKQVAQALIDEGDKASVVVGLYAQQHIDAALIRYLSALLTRLTGARFELLTEGANTAGAWLAGAIPHRLPAGKVADQAGDDAYTMLKTGKTAYVLHGIEPSLDTAAGTLARRALEKSEFTVAFTAFDSDELRQHAHVLLPIATLAETSGTMINVTQQWQSFAGAVKPAGEARPAWKVYRVLGNRFELPGFEYQSSAEVLAELRDQFDAEANAMTDRQSYNLDNPLPGDIRSRGDAIYRVGGWPTVRSDMLVRHAEALQETASAQVRMVGLHPKTAAKHGLVADRPARIATLTGEVVCPWYEAHDLAEDTVVLPSGLAAHVLGDHVMGEVTISQG